MIIVRNVGDQLFITNNSELWLSTVDGIRSFSKIFLTMAMAAIGMSTNLRDIKNMGFKPFVVGFIGMATVGIVCLGTIEIYLYLFN